MSKGKVPKPKYIAEGFHEDAGKILDKFIDKNTTEFSEFATIWREHHFSLIYMGRPDHIENTEFTNEIFKITLQFLPAASFFKKVGAVYFLYALFRNQISDPPIKIRLEIQHWKVINTLHTEAKLRHFKTLHYVIDYLTRNAFIFVASSTLKGPLTNMQILSKNYELISNLKANYKSDIMAYSTNNGLQALRDLHLQYLEEKKNLDGLVKIQLNPCSDSYELFIHDLKEIVEPGGTSKDKKDCLGSRRAKIKAYSFSRKTQDRFGNDVEEETNETVPDANIIETPKKKGKKQRKKGSHGVPKHERRVGRPSKKPKPKKEPESESDDNIDISHLLSQQKDFFLPPIGETECKKNRTRRDHYYKVSPKREDSSDPDIPD